MAKAKQVTSFTLVWIKMPLRCAWRIPAGVTSFTLVWIKIAYRRAPDTPQAASRASRSCGLKYDLARWA